MNRLANMPDPTKLWSSANAPLTDKVGAAFPRNRATKEATDVATDEATDGSETKTAVNNGTSLVRHLHEITAQASCWRSPHCVVQLAVCQVARR